MRSNKIAPSITLLFGLAVWLLPAAAQADPSAAGENLGERGYTYEFGDDPLQAGNNGAYTARIRVLPRGVRQTLIRPRMHFVPEMLKSVENL